MVLGRAVNQEPSVYKTTVLYTQLQCWLGLQGLLATFVAYNES